MVPLDATPAMDVLARRIIWFEEPAKALADPIRFVAYALEHGTHGDLAQLALTEADIRDVLAHAPPGIIGPRSWAFWHAKTGTYPAPPMPRRHLPV